MNIISLNNVLFSHKDKSHADWQVEFDVTITRGEKVAIVGASGAGKSTLLSLIAGFAMPETGEILLNGENHSKTPPHARPISMLFQDNNLFNHLSVSDNIALGIAPNLKLNDIQRQGIQTIAEQVGLGEHLSRLPDKLSGGQQQRVALARCLLRDKPILLLDEPFSALDSHLRMEMLELLRELCEKKSLTVLMVTHHVDEVSTFIDRAIVIDRGRVSVS